MKKITLLLFLLISTAFYAQSTISYQAIIYNPNGEVIPGYNNTNSPLANKNICLQFTIVDGDLLTEYQEKITVSTDEFGMVNTVIGNGIQTGGYATSLANVNWSLGSKRLKVALDTFAQCSNFLEISDQLLTSVPYAFSANRAENVTGVVSILNGGTGASTVLGATTNLGLQNVDNTRDLNKPISTYTQAALNLKEDVSNKSTNVSTDGTSNTMYPSVKAVKDYVDANLATATPDATTAVKGKVQLAGDFTGTAALPRIAANAITSSKILDGEIVNADISATAAIVDTKLATIETSGKVSNSATTATSLNIPKTIVLRDGSGNLAAGSITATGFLGPLTGNVVGNVTGNVSGTAANVSGTVAIANGGTGSTTQNFVDLTTAQTVAGAKTFSSNVTGNSFIKSGGTSSQFLKADGSVDSASYITASGTAANVSGTVAIANGGTGSTTQNFVDLTTAQTVAGAKTFSSDINVNSLTVGHGGSNVFYNNAFGFQALNDNTTGNYNNSFGFQALALNTTGSQNSAFGQVALYKNEDGSYNTAMGLNALNQNKNGSENTAFGHSALLSNTTGSNNTALGFQANVASSNLSNATAIGNGATVNSSNAIQLGNTAVTSVSTYGTLTAGTVTYPNAHNSIAGQVLTTDASGVASWATLSVTEVADEISATVGQVTFTLTQTPAIKSKVKMYINGIRITNTAYTISGNTLTYVPANNGSYNLIVGDRIQFDYYY